jgi:hypothetical protein
LTDLGLKTFNKLYPMMIKKYQDLIVDQNANEKDKINQIIQKLNALGKLSNDVVRDWNTVYQWVMNDGLATDVNNKLEDMRANGEINDILNNIFNHLAGDLTELHTSVKDTLVHAINEVDDLAKQNQTDIETITVDVETNTTNIATNTANIASNAAQLTQNTSYLVDYVNPITYGAKFNGVDDDAPGLTTALQHGNVKIPSGKTVTIKSTVQISNPQRIIEGNECVVNVADNVTAFQVGTLSMTASLLNINLRNMFVVMGNNSNFFLSYNSYFIKLSNIRLTNINGTGYGAKIVNGFNITFNEFHLNGANSGVANISGNNASGIIIETNTSVSPNVIGTSNITNVLIDSCLIQRLQYGIYFNNVGNTVYDSNKFNNIGFSMCDNAITTNTAKSYNLQVKLLRCENSGTLLTNDGQISLEDVYCYETKYSFTNGADGYIILNSMFYHWNPTVTGGYIIQSNAGIISFKNLTYLERTGSVGQYATTAGRVIQRQSPYLTTKQVNSGSTLTIDAFTIYTYDQQSYLDFANVTGNDGSEFYIMSSNGSNFLLPNGLYQYNNTLSNLLLHCKIIGTVVEIVGEQALMTQLSVAGGITGTAKQAIQVMKTTANISEFHFGNLGLTFLYATTAGITLSNGSSSIVNFSSLNGGSAVDLSTTPLILVPFMDGSGKGFAIKS